MKKKNYILMVVLVILLALGGTRYFQQKNATQAGVVSSNLSEMGTESAFIFPKPVPLGAFTVRDTENNLLNERDLRGNWHVLFFGYTYCPDVCPATLITMQETWEALQSEGLADEVTFVFVSVDPERDTPEQLKGYIDHFNPEFLGLTGTPAQIARFGDNFGVIAEPIENEEDSEHYLVNHTGAVMFIDPQGRYYARLSPPMDSALLTKDLQAIMHHYEL